MRMKRLQLPIGILFFVLFWGNNALAQGVNIGIPPVHHFNKKMYKAGTQNWDAAQDRRGVLYFANNEGLLQYDGRTWTCFPVENRTVVRSVAIDAVGRIWVGAQSELGYFFPGPDGRLHYNSLLSALPPEKRNFEDVWDIVFDQNAVLFRTNRSVFRWQNNQLETLDVQGGFTGLFSTAQGTLLQRDMNHLMVYRDGQFAPLLSSADLQSPVTGLMPWGADTLICSTLKNGLFYLSNGQLSPCRTPHDALLREKRIYSATILPNGYLALGTSLSGLLVLDQQHRLYRHLNKSNSLQNNNILCVFADRANSVWLGLDSGIDCAVLDAPFTTVIPDGDLLGTGYAAAVFNQELYLGVSNGLYKIPWKNFYNPEHKLQFEKINPAEGQVWALQPLGNQLLLGHHEGAFTVGGASVQRISTVPGGWTFVQMSESFALGGTYSGLVLYQKKGEQWVFDQKLKGLNESCRIMVRDPDGSVWVAHPYRGLYRVWWSAAQKDTLRVDFYDVSDGLPSNLNNYVFNVAGKPVFATQKGVYRFDATRQTFVPDDDFNRVIGPEKNIRLLKEDTEGNIWYVADQEVGLLQLEDFGLKKNIRKVVFPELAERLVGGFELIYPVDHKNVFFGAEQGFIHYNAAAPVSADTVLQLVLSKVTANGYRDTLLFTGWFVHPDGIKDAQYAGFIPVLDAELNNLRFVFSATDYKEPAFVQYRYRLKGLESGWSEWSAESVKNYTNLEPGTYTFEVQARRKDGRESATVAYSFRIRPPWYASGVALALYALGLLGLFVGFVFRQKRQFENEKERLTEQHEEVTAAQQREVERSIAALNEIQHAKLEADIHFKNQELATATMHLVQKGEVLLTVQEYLNDILQKSTHQEVKKDIQQLLNMLNFDAKLDEDWQQFAYHFDQVHVHFLQRLREKYPQLSANDHKLCAYLRMNLASKEIAPLMNISVRGVEASRYRLRKKLGLPNDANLTEWVLSV